MREPLKYISILLFLLGFNLIILFLLSSDVFFCSGSKAKLESASICAQTLGQRGLNHSALHSIYHHTYILLQPGLFEPFRLNIQSLLASLFTVRQALIPFFRAGYNLSCIHLQACFYVILLFQDKSQQKSKMQTHAGEGGTLHGEIVLFR